MAINVAIEMRVGSFEAPLPQERNRELLQLRVNLATKFSHATRIDGQPPKTRLRKL